MSTPLSSAFVDHLQTLFSFLDEGHLGVVRLVDIETNWSRGVAGLPDNLIPFLAKVAAPDNTLSFPQFVHGVRLAFGVASGNFSLDGRENNVCRDAPLTNSSSGYSSVDRPLPSYESYMHYRNNRAPSNGTALAGLTSRSSASLPPRTAWSKNGNGFANGVNGHSNNDKKSHSLRNNRTLWQPREPVILQRNASAHDPQVTSNGVNGKHPPPAPPPRTISQHRPRRPLTYHADLMSASVTEESGHMDQSVINPRMTSSTWQPPVEEEDDSFPAPLRQRSKSFSGEVNLHFSEGLMAIRSLHAERRCLKECLGSLERTRARLQCRLERVNEELSLPRDSKQVKGEQQSAARTPGQLRVLQLKLEQACHILASVDSDEEAPSRPRGQPPSEISSPMPDPDLQNQLDTLSRELTQAQQMIARLEREKSAIARTMFEKRTLKLSTDI